MSTADHNALDPRLELCEERIGYRFRDRGRLLEALTHASGAEHRVTSNERLEFLGDAVLGWVICEALYRRFPEELEGELTRIKSIVVSRRACADAALAMGLEDCLILGKGMATHETLPDSLLSDVFESLVAAVYLDGGEAPAREFIHENLDEAIDEAAGGGHGGNYKSLLQQLAQRDFGSTPTYHLLDEKGPDHSKSFKIFAQIGKSRYAPAWGRNKKEAEQRAALNALSQIDNKEIPYPGDE